MPEKSPMIHNLNSEMTMNKEPLYVCTLNPKKIEEITNFDWLSAINSGISSCGFFMVGVIPSKEERVDKEDSGYCYTIGLARKWAPDVCVMLGKLKAGKPLTSDCIAKEANAVTVLFNHLVSENIKIEPGHTFETSTGQVYFADRYLSVEEKQQLTSQASNFYQNSDYAVLLIRPITVQ